MHKNYLVLPKLPNSSLADGNGNGFWTCCKRSEVHTYHILSQDMIHMKILDASLAFFWPSFGLLKWNWGFWSISWERGRVAVASVYHLQFHPKQQPSRSCQLTDHQKTCAHWGQVIRRPLIWAVLLIRDRLGFWSTTSAGSKERLPEEIAVTAVCFQPSLHSIWYCTNWIAWGRWVHHLCL